MQKDDNPPHKLISSVNCVFYCFLHTLFPNRCNIFWFQLYQKTTNKHVHSNMLLQHISSNMLQNQQPAAAMRQICKIFAVFCTFIWNFLQQLLLLLWSAANMRTSANCRRFPSCSRGSAAVAALHKSSAMCPCRYQGCCCASRLIRPINISCLWS